MNSASIHGSLVLFQTVIKLSSYPDIKRQSSYPDDKR